MGQLGSAKHFAVVALGIVLALGAYLSVDLQPAAGVGSEQFDVSLSTDESCGAAGVDELVVPLGTDVTFCYILKNTEDAPLQIKSLGSNTFDEFDVDPDLILDPNETLEHRITVKVSETVADSAVWQPVDGDGKSYMATATATVLVEPTIAIAFSDQTLTIGETGTVSLTISNPNSLAIDDLNVFVNLGNGALDLSLPPVRDCASSTGPGLALIRFFPNVESFAVDRISLHPGASCTVTAEFTAQDVVTHALQGNALRFYHDPTPLLPADGPRTDLTTPVPAPTISVLAPFGPPTLLAPDALVVAPPEFRWSRTDGVDSYRLWVTDLTGGGKVYDEFLGTDHGLACVADECSATPPDISLDEGSSYRWWIRAHGPDQAPEWSNHLDFTVEVTPEIPEQVTLIAPSGTGVAATPEFVWTEDIHATAYRLQVLSEEGTVLDAVLSADGDVTCALGQCSVTPPGLILEDGEYGFFVTALSPLGNAPVSEVLGFFTGPPAVIPAQVTPISPTGLGIESTPDFVWTEDTDATHYRLWIQSRTGAGVVHDEIHSVEFDISCGEGECYIAAFGLTLDEDLYRWWVQARSPAGNGPWSTHMDFSTEPVAAVPGQVALIAPNGGGVSATPEFVWTEDTDATHYRLWIQSRTGAGVVNDVVHGIDADVNCADSECRLTPPGLTLDGDLYRWWVLPQSPAGSGTWSDAMDFSTQPEATVPGKVVLFGPDGAGFTTTPEFRWQEDAAATHYRLWIQSLNGAGIVHDIIHDAAGEVSCAGGECTITPAGLTLSAGDYRWWVQGQSPAGNGSWSDEMDFTVD